MCGSRSYCLEAGEPVNPKGGPESNIHTYICICITASILTTYHTYKYHLYIHIANSKTTYKILIIYTIYVYIAVRRDRNGPCGGPFHCLELKCRVGLFSHLFM